MTRVEYERLKSELLNVQNPALDNDRRTLLSRLETLGFDKRLSEALNEQARNHDALIRQHLVPDREWKPVDRGPAVAERVGDDLILERVLADAGEGGADFLGESVSEARFARLVVVLRSGDIGLRERSEADGPVQGAG